MFSGRSNDDILDKDGGDSKWLGFQDFTEDVPDEDEDDDGKKGRVVMSTCCICTSCVRCSGRGGCDEQDGVG